MISLLILIPFVAAVISYFIGAVGPRKKLLFALAVLATAVECAIGMWLSLEVAASGPFNAGTLFSVDALSALLLLIVTPLGFLTILYSIGYLRVEVAKGIIGPGRTKQFFVLMHFFLFAFFVAVSTTHPILMWIAIEATTLSTAFLMSFYNKPSATEAAWKYLIINSVGLLLAFFGTLIFFGSAVRFLDGSAVTWQSMTDIARFMDPAVVKLGFILILIGFGTKMGLVPLHTWKPDAYSKAPTSAVALFSGAFLSVACYAILRFKIITDTALGSEFSAQFFLFFAVISVVFSALAMFVQKNYKRMLAYSSIENAGVLALGFAVGGLGIFGALLHMIVYTFIKALLFFAAGNIFLKYSSTKIDNVRDAFKKIPMTSIFWLLGFLMITGTLPVGIFMSKWYILSAGMKTAPILTTIICVGLVVIFIGLFRHVVFMLFGKYPKEGMSMVLSSGDNKGQTVQLDAIAAGESHWLTVVVPLVLLVTMALWMIFLPQPLAQLLEAAMKLFTNA